VQKNKATEFVIDKVTEGVASAVVTHETQSASLKTNKDGLSKANEVMENMANHQVMSMAPTEICE
jgi:hypothetical protein